jgi:hypothetical protein
MSGLVLSDDVRWISFHSSYDFGYLVKTLTCTELPMDEVAFMDLLHTYFPYIYDVKVSSAAAIILVLILICFLILPLPYLNTQTTTPPLCST